MRRFGGSMAADRGEGSPDPWMITFIDLCTLLLAFFVLLMSMSSLNQKKLRSAFRGIGDERVEKTAEAPPEVEDWFVKDLLDALGSVYKGPIGRLDDVSADMLRDGRPTASVAERVAVWMGKGDERGGASVILEGGVLFDEGGSTLRPEAAPILQELGVFMKESGRRALIDVHTDDAPAYNKESGSPGELSMAQALALVEFFLSQCNVNADKLAVGAYGATQPVSEVDSTAARAMSRRVEIIFEKPGK